MPPINSTNNRNNSCPLLIALTIEIIHAPPPPPPPINNTNNRNNSCPPLIALTIEIIHAPH